MAAQKQSAIKIVVLSNLLATKKLARQLAKKAKGGAVFGLVGDLGAGKTTFTQFFASALGVQSRVVSPTYILVQYHGGTKFTLCHIDAYRANSAAEVGMAGLDDALANKKIITVIEWADKIRNALPPDTTWLTFTRMGRKRSVAITTS